MPIVETTVIPVHRSVSLVNHCGGKAEATVIANPADHPWLYLNSDGLSASVHMRPEDAIALGHLLLAAGEIANWALVNPTLLEAC